MRILLYISRLIVGPLFIVSGLIKANDPLGFSYKLEEYFVESALDLPFLVPFALTLAVLACLAEVVLGFAVLFGGRMKLATWASIAGSVAALSTKVRTLLTRHHENKGGTDVL